ncbi:MAG TPA: 5-formyltetrahydrofolate cyclo-ligase [Clostridia bacterium]|nr:MAG: 5-formyltetrahydrofolate cyclo-ligase family protein [Firmicutes bacterium ADurb.Bin146]HOD93563.1 5-formyltetrahydrofolate cyclo-ligase [Clostridia bacterium]
MDILDISSKKALRLYMKRRREELHPTQVIEYSLELFNRFLVSDLINYKNYMTYLPIKNEADTSQLINYLLDEGKNVSVPFIDENKKLIPLQIKRNILYEKDSFGIQIPKEKILFPPEKLEVIFVPGLAFDFQGNRIGYGKGYYDVFLRDLDCITCAWCYDFQIIKKLPDVSLNDVKIKRFL